MKVIITKDQKLKYIKLKHYLSKSEINTMKIWSCHLSTAVNFEFTDVFQASQ